MTNIAATLEAQLDALSLRQMRVIAGEAERQGLRAYLVGGAVRDSLLEIPVADIDITIEGLTPTFAQAVSHALRGEIVARSQFNTFALNASGRRIDLAMARQESYAYPGALPTVSPGSIQQDLARRDFAINSMAASISNHSWGELLDPFLGQRDLNARSIRILRNASFKDDATRILRAARYAVRLGFSLEEDTERLIMQDAAYLDAISGARLNHEFQRALQESGAVSTIKTLHRLGVLKHIHPSLAPDPPTISALRRASQTTAETAPALYMSILSHNANPDDRAAIIDRLSLSNRLAQLLQDTALLGSRMQELNRRDHDTISRSQIYTLLRSYDETAILACALYAGDAPAARHLMLFLQELRHIAPILNGNDLLRLGVPQSAQIGELLHKLLMARLDEKLKTREDEINFILAGM